MPGAAGGGLIAVNTEMRGEGHRRNVLSERQFARRVIGRIAADDHQRVDMPGPQFLAQSAQRLAVTGRDRIHRRDEIDWRVKLLVDPMTEGVHVGALPRTRLNQGSATPGGEVGCGNLDELIAPGRQLRRVERRAESARDLDREVSNEIRPYGQAMIGESTGERVRRLGDVKPQRSLGLARLPRCDNVVARAGSVAGRNRADRCRASAPRAHRQSAARQPPHGQTPATRRRSAASSSTGS